ncbi:MAG: AzlD domain-containing protein [Actinobacteria bacterium]|nr:AzlD domain-containing protein [Actinomycetota bacterium]
MSDLVLVLIVATVTYASRVVFLLNPRSVPEGWVGRFLELFPLTLFVAIATAGMAAPEGSIELTPALAAAGGGLLGAVVFKRSLWGVLAVGAVAYYVVRALAG